MSTFMSYVTYRIGLLGYIIKIKYNTIISNVRSTLARHWDSSIKLNPLSQGVSSAEHRGHVAWHFYKGYLYFIGFLFSCWHNVVVLKKGWCFIVGLTFTFVEHWNWNTRFQSFNTMFWMIMLQSGTSVTPKFNFIVVRVVYIIAIMELFRYIITFSYYKIYLFSNPLIFSEI